MSSSCPCAKCASADERVTTALAMLSVSGGASVSRSSSAPPPLPHPPNVTAIKPTSQVFRVMPEQRSGAGRGCVSAENRPIQAIYRMSVRARDRGQGLLFTVQRDQRVLHHRAVLVEHPRLEARDRGRE